MLVVTCICTGAEWISWGLGKGAQATGYLIVKGKDQLKKNVKSDEKAAEIDEKYQTGVLYARKATGVAVKVRVNQLLLHPLYFHHLITPVQ